MADAHDPLNRNPVVDIPVTRAVSRPTGRVAPVWHGRFWIVVLLATVALLYFFKSTAMPFLGGLFLAYLLNPLATRMQRLGLNRLGASLIILTVFLVAVAAALIFALPPLASQMASLLEKLPNYASRLQTLVVEQGGPLLEKYGGQAALQDFEKSLSNIVGQMVNFVGAFLASVWSGGQALIGVFSLLIIVPVVTFYLLIDWPDIVRTVDGWIPIRSRNTVRAIAGDIDRAIGGFLWGQGLVCLFLATFYAVGLSLVQLNFGLLIGLLTGALTFIPYVGALTGLVLAMAVAIAQFWPDATTIFLVLGIYLAGQFLEGYILSPKLVGESIGLHPVWLMFALFAFGSVFGFLGLLVAVPLAAAAGVVVRFAMARYMASSLYRGEDAVGPL